MIRVFVTAWDIRTDEFGELATFDPVTDRIHKLGDNIPNIKWSRVFSDSDTKGRHKHKLCLVIVECEEGEILKLSDLQNLPKTRMIPTNKLNSRPSKASVTANKRALATLGLNVSTLDAVTTEDYLTAISKAIQPKHQGFKDFRNRSDQF